MADKPKKVNIPKNSEIEGSVQTSEFDFKQTLLDTLQESNTARNEMKMVLHELLRQDDTVSEITDIINKVDRDAVKQFWSKFGFTTWSAIVFVAGAVVTVVISNLLAK